VTNILSAEDKWEQLEFMNQMINLPEKNINALTNKCKAALFDKIWNDSAEQLLLAQALYDGQGYLADYVVIDINSSFEKLTGLRKNLLSGKRVTELFPYDDPEWLRKCRDSLGSGLNQKTEPDKWQDIQVFQLNSDKRLFPVTRDISRNLQAELTFQDSQRFFAVNPDLMCILDDNANFLKLNQAWADVLGYSLEELKKHKYLDYVHPEDLPDTLTAGAGLVNQREEVNFINRCRKSDGTYCYLEWHSRRYQNLIYATARDITAQKKTEEALRESEEKYRLIAEHTADVFWVWNATRGCLTYVSPSIRKLTGYTPEEYMQQSIEEIFSPEIASAVLEEIRISTASFMKDPGLFRSNHRQLQNICKNKKTIWVECSVEYRYNNKQEIEIYGVSRDITERKTYEQQLQYLCYHDPLTGLFNRLFLEEEIKRLDTGRNLPISIIMADVDRLKLINDTFGHKKGDEFIIKAANLIKANCRPEDLVARYGGDEFVIFLPRTSAEEAEKIVDRIKNNCAGQYVNSIEISISFGCAEKISSEENAEEIILVAENAMYRAKTEERERSKKDIINTIVQALYQKEPYEEQHAKRVSALCRATAEALGYSKPEVEKLALAGLIHDIGKAAVSSNILKKSYSLNEDECWEMKKHTTIGYQVIGTDLEMKDIGSAVLAHHERMDGKGYPKGIERKDIPVAARIIAIAEAYDTMTSQNAYRQPRTKEEAVSEIRKNKGTQFDPEIAELFISKVLNKNETT
jgi:diguanylate cyclase (GGDEF)-like protein/PAS domain S-box-containing protein